MTSREKLKLAFRQASVQTCVRVAKDLIKKGIAWTLIFGALIASSQMIERKVSGAYDYSRNGVAIQNPKILVIETPGVGGIWGETVGLKLTFPKAQIVRGQEYGNEESIIDEIQKYVDKYGALDELVINAHGSPNKFYPDGTGASKTLFRVFLNHLRIMQEDSHKKIAYRIVSLGCNTFTNLTPQDVKLYKIYALLLNAEIVGATATTDGGFFATGRFVKFTPDARVARDRLDMPYDPFALFDEAQSRYDGYSSSWFDRAQNDQPEPQMPVINLALKAPRAVMPLKP